MPEIHSIRFRVMSAYKFIAEKQKLVLPTLVNTVLFMFMRLISLICPSFLQFCASLQIHNLSPLHLAYQRTIAFTRVIKEECGTVLISCVCNLNLFQMCVAKGRPGSQICAKG